MMEFAELGKLLEAGMKDAKRAPSVDCPGCGAGMATEIGFGKLSGYLCMNFGCQMNGRRITVEQLSDSQEWQLWQDEARIRKETFAAMRERNGAHDRDSRESLDAIAKPFEKQHGLTHRQLQEQLIADQKSALAISWHQYIATNMDCYCSECHGYHKPTPEHPLCRFCSPGFVHAQMPPEIYFNYRGWKWTPPFICMGCGIEVCYRQWAFSRSCGPCDVSDSKTRRLLSGKCFAGPHLKLESWSEGEGDIPASHFVNPSDRLKYPIMRVLKRQFPPKKNRLRPR